MSYLHPVQLTVLLHTVPLCYRLAQNCTGARGANYFILLILTDGVIRDKAETCEAIVNVSPATAAAVVLMLTCNCRLSVCEHLGTKTFREETSEVSLVFSYVSVSYLVNHSCGAIPRAG